MVTHQLLIWSISTNILTALANFLHIHNSIFSKNIGHDRGNTSGQPKSTCFGDLILALEKMPQKV